MASGVNEEFQPPTCNHIWRVLHPEDPRVQLRECILCFDMDDLDETDAMA